jgi:hypothetical protein
MVSMSYEYEEEYYSPSWTYIKQRAPFEGHYANKNEAKALRRIMSQTGLTEAEVRSIKKYRIELSQAQKDPKGSWGMARCKRFRKESIKYITRKLGLALEHPKTQEAIKAWAKEYFSNSYTFRGHHFCNCKSYFKV